MEEMLERIKQADLQELDDILCAAEARFKVLVPDWETVYLFLPKNDWQARQKHLEMAVEFLRKHYEPMP